MAAMGKDMKSGRQISAESETLKIRKFMERDPAPLGRVRTHGVSCLQYYGTELTVGDIHGKVFIWNLKEQKCLWDIQAHTGKVCCLQVLRSFFVLSLSL